MSFATPRSPIKTLWSGTSRPFAASVLLTVLMMVALSYDPAASAGTRDPYELLQTAGLERDVKLGYVLRADTWGGDLPTTGAKRIEYTLLHGNDYRFYAYTTTKGARISFHVQDQDGVVVEARCWQTEKEDFCFAGADVIPKSTGSYYLIVKVEQSPADRTDWALLYAYK